MAKNQLYDKIARIGVASSDVNFVMRAFADYCERKQQNLNDMLDLMQEAISLIPEDSDDASAIEAQVYDLLLQAHPGYNLDQNVLLDEGYTTVRSCLSLMIHSVTDGENSLHPNKMALKNAAGTIVSSVSYADLAQGLQAQLHSLVGLVACNRAQLYSSISDRLQAFNDTMNSTFANAYSDISSSLGYYKSLLQQHLNPVAYLQNIAGALDLEALASDNSETLPKDTDISHFTGASPAGPLNFESFTAATSAVVNTGIKVVKGIFSAVKNVVSPLVNKAVSTVKETLVDPYDIYVSNESSDINAVEQFCYYGNLNISKALWAPSNIDEEHFSFLKEYYASHSKWFKLGLVGGELLFQVRSVSAEGDLSCAYRYRPKAVSAELISTVKAIVGSATQLTDEMIQKITSVTSSADFYLSTDSSEDDLYAGFYRGALFDRVMMDYAGEEVRGNGNVSASATWSSRWSPERLSGSSATNKDFVNIVSGLIDNPGADYIVANYSILGTTSSGSNTIPIMTIVYDAISCLSCNLLAEYDSPTDFPFYPYRYDKEDFSNGKFSIKTDAENYNAFNTFVTNAIIVTVGVITAAAVGCVAKKLMNKITQKAIERKSVLDAKMWNGEKLSASEAKQYRRASRKAECSSLLSSSLQTSSQTVATGSMDSTNSTVSGIQSIQAILRG